MNLDDKKKYRDPSTTAEMVMVHLEKVREEYGSAFPSASEFYRKHLFVITANYAPTRTSIKSVANVRTVHSPNNGRVLHQTTKHPLKWFGILYHQIARATVGNNLNRKRRMQPLCYAFVDFKGSKTATKINCDNATLPHVHAIMLVRPEHVSDFEQFRKKVKVDQVRSTQLLIERFDSPDFHCRLRIDGRICEEPSVHDAITYAMKGYRKFDPRFSGREELASIFPHHNTIGDKRQKPSRHMKSVRPKTSEVVACL